MATRVIFGYSGQLDRLTTPNRWLIVAVSLMLFARATRISGDVWPKVLVSHYVYGALIWVAGVLLWGLYVLPNVRRRDVECTDFSVRMGPPDDSMPIPAFKNTRAVPCPV